MPAAKPVRMVVVNGVRYREEDAPKAGEERAIENQPVKNKMRTTRTASKK